MGAFEQPWKTLTGVPAIDFAAKRYTAVNFTTGGKIATATAAGHTIGIIQEPSNIDAPANVIAQGFSFAIYGGTIAAGDPVEIGADGKFVKASAGVRAGIAAVAGVTGDIGTVLLK